MRIRKHASTIIDAQKPRAGMVDVCKLNRSPWDVFPSPSAASFLEGTIEFGNQTEEPMSAIHRKHRETSSLAESKDEAMQEENVDPKKAKKPTMKKEVDSFTCKKTDGKLWRCKRPAHQSNSYCDYHLSQLQSYSYRARAPGHGGHGRRPRRWKRLMMDSDVYFCSAFGPWRSGKHRDGGSFIAATHAQEHEADDDDDEDDDSSDDEHDPLSINARKRVWKPVKSRSLNSLF